MTASLPMARRLLAVAAAWLLAGCAVGPDFVRPAPPADAGYEPGPARIIAIDAGQESQRLLPGAEVRADWWHLFGSARLDEMVALALARSPTLEAAQARLRQSQDELRAGQGVYFPRIDANAGAERARSAPIQTGSSAKSSLFNVVTLEGVISYPLDLFGGARRALEGQQAISDGQGHAVRAAALALTANLVNTAISLAACEAEILAQRELLAIEEAQWRSMLVQVGAGIAPFADVLPLRAQIGADKAALAQLEQRAAQARHLLALLQGEGPAHVQPEPGLPFDELQLPPDLPLSLPSVLVRQRPDILAAEADLHVASANVGVATAAEFPTFGLSAGYGGAGTGLGNLTVASGRFWSTGASLALPLFRGGMLRWQRQAAVDAFEAQQAQYRETVLSAFAQVADAMKALQFDAQVQQAQGEAEHATAAALSLLQTNYSAGLAAAVDVLAAHVRQRRALIETIRAKAQREQDAVALFAALGGGWWNEPAR